MGFWKRRRVVEPTGPDPDLKDSKARVEQALSAAQRRNEVVQQMSLSLAERRKLNHFGDDLAITFVRKETRHA